MIIIIFAKSSWEKRKMQCLFCISWNDTRSLCFIKSVPVVLGAHSDLALQLLESRNASPASRVISAAVDGEQ